ncbi:39S ribosomal protein L28, mitochondrial [Adelges cooleyi]|uniref:39S ribosomal protein L28, mitochondrial n=1 Tax=Adelges cooleyi TaxID=133065 RepID=UPI00217F9D78|nr:39S ribosomal protein L28, mitochondrial [Adelges cooleyi]
MESKLANGLKMLYIPNKTKINSGIGDRLPEAYKKFYKEWRHRTPAPVYYQPKTGKWTRDEKSGQVIPVQNVPIPLKYPPSMHKGIWGGEAIVQGFKQNGKYKSRVPYFWIPSLKKTVVYSEVLDTYMSATVTEHAIDLINKNYGFDNYLLKTAACDLKSTLSLKLKRRILIALRDKTLYPDDPAKQQIIYDKYKHYLNDYSHEEIEWYGLTFSQALLKQLEREEITLQNRQPLKEKFRMELIEELKNNIDTSGEENKTWLTKLNPFK